MSIVEMYHRFTRWNFIRNDFRKAIDRLKAEIDSKEEKDILDKVSLPVHKDDAMYVDNAFHYLSVGLSASRCIREAIRYAPSGYTVGSILDFPCGYGRVLRFLKAMFPNSAITAAEIDSNALDFCRDNFSVSTLLSKTNLSELSFPQRFDLIWCGSLFTHIDEKSMSNLLKFFYDHLSDKGICVFTTHGQYPVEWIESKKVTYGLTEESQQKIVSDFNLKGCGYANYPNQADYGISAVSRQRLLELATIAGSGWREILFLERGWDNHQDVYAFTKMPTCNV